MSHTESGRLHLRKVDADFLERHPSAFSLQQFNRAVDLINSYIGDSTDDAFLFFADMLKVLASLSLNDNQVLAIVKLIALHNENMKFVVILPTDGIDELEEKYAQYLLTPLEFKRAVMTDSIPHPEKINQTIDNVKSRLRLGYQICGEIK
jgi:hypothetical protein